MSLLTICRNAANEIGFTAPSTIIGNTDDTAVRLLRAANRTGSTLVKKPFHQLIKPYTFTTMASEPQYDLPSDFRSMVHTTAWNRTTDQRIFIISPQRWSYEKSAVTTNYHDQVRFLGDDTSPSIGRRFTIHPTPEATETIAYEYFSTNWLTDSGGTTERSAFAADTDVPILDEDLFELGVIWRFLKSVGQSYAEEKMEYDREVDIALAHSQIPEKLYADGNQPAISNWPETGYG